MYKWWHRNCLRIVMGVTGAALGVAVYYGALRREGLNLPDFSTLFLQGERPPFAEVFNVPTPTKIPPSPTFTAPATPTPFRPNSTEAPTPFHTLVASQTPQEEILGTATVEQTSTPQVSDEGEGEENISAEELIASIEAKIGEERTEENVYLRVPMYRGRNAGVYLMSKLTAEILRFLGIEPETKELLERGYDIKILWEGKRWKIFEQGVEWTVALSKVCVIYDSERYNAFEGPSFIVLSEIGRVKPLNSGGTRFLAQGTNRFAVAADILGAAWTSAQGVKVNWEGDNRIEIVIEKEGDVVAGYAFRMQSINSRNPNRRLKVGYFSTFEQITISPEAPSLEWSNSCNAD